MVRFIVSRRQSISSKIQSVSSLRHELTRTHYHIYIYRYYYYYYTYTHTSMYGLKPKIGHRATRTWRELRHLFRHNGSTTAREQRVRGSQDYDPGQGFPNYGRRAGFGPRTSIKRPYRKKARKLQNWATFWGTTVILASNLSKKGSATINEREIYIQIKQ